MRAFLVFVIIVCFLYEIFCQKSCNNFETCGTCIGFSGDRCVWCSETNLTEKRCQTEKYYRTNKIWCDKAHINNPDMETHEMVKNDNVRPGTKKLQPIQFQPQEMNLKLRSGGSYKFQMSYKPAEDFPLDVYYLMDYSYTMWNHINKLGEQAKSVYIALSKFSNNVQFGIGGFVEKPEFPFVDTGIQYSYSFRNHLSLTKDMDEFMRVIDRQNKFSGSNYDIPEAALDALMQVMACEENLKWRSESRRIIVLCTDAPYHSAGDGKMVGAWKPNDLKCHLNSSQVYDWSLLQDYPSVSQINKMAKDGNFKIIFAAVAGLQNEYKLLANQIFGSKYVMLEENSNIEAIIKDAYMESINYTMIKHQWPSYVQLKLEPDCTKNYVCVIKHQQILQINATIQITECPENRKDFKQVLDVGPVSGGLADKLKIYLEIDCQCECEVSNSGIKNSSHCSSSGTLQCGICECNNDRSGSTCQCDGAITTKVELEKCKENINDTNFCNGRGKCVCGKCDCESGYSGNYCEFNDKQCDRKDDKLCAGNGRCTLGSCHCSPEWTGDDCSCTVNTFKCYLPFSKEICSGNGECVCGECICHKEKGKSGFIGSFCDDCDECAEKRCKELESYVNCNYWNNQTYCDQLQQHNQTFITEIQVLNKSEINSQSLKTAKLCYIKLDNGTSIVFTHNYDKSNKKLLLLIQKELEEESKQKIWVAVGIAIGTVLLIGLLTVIAWKIVMDKMDEREYNNFMKKAQEAGFDVSNNPIYQPAATSFTNPTYYDNSSQK